jgi:predicted kinase
VLIVSADEAAAERFATRVLEEQSALLATSKIRALLAGKVPDDQIEDKGGALRDAAATKRLTAGQSVVVTTRGLDPAERERLVLLAAGLRRPRHLILLEVPRDEVSEQDHAPLGALRTALDQGQLGEEGFMTSLRLGGAAVGELKRIVFAPPPADD